MITSSHAHTDHLDGETLSAVLNASRNARLVVPASVREMAVNRLAGGGHRIDDIDVGSPVDIAGFRITAVPSAHEELERDDMGRYRFFGYIVQFGPWTVYHSGDTVLYEGMADRLKPFGIDVALLPINGRIAQVPGNMNAREAAWLGREIGARLVIPCHYDMFTFNTGRVEEFTAAADEAEQRYSVSHCGERWASSMLES
ncbi:MAG: MBL fold metallo-hydrolase [Bryobacteraceae bacterium]